MTFNGGVQLTDMTPIGLTIKIVSNQVTLLAGSLNYSARTEPTNIEFRAISMNLNIDEVTNMIR